MVESVDANRIKFEELNIEDKAKELGLLAPIKDVLVRSSSAYKGMPVDVSSSKNQENLVDMREFGIKTIPYYLEQAQYNPTYGKNIPGAPDVIYAREGVCEALQNVNNDLEPLGLEIVCYDAHRSPATQMKLYKSFLGIAFEKGLKGKEAQDFALSYCSNPEGFDKNDPNTWTIHSTGAAVDVYLMDRNTQKVIDLGEEYFDNPDDVTHTEHFENLQKENKLAPEQHGYLKARRILYNAMNNNGFKNFGYETFHYGMDDPWAALYEKTMKNNQTAKASYGYKESPKDNQLSNIMGALISNASNKR
ncbi:MAG: hypothetical protein LBL47_01145 [Lactobacillus sp.]|jgi:D-alanyl-D-alanine dipeptidase|nr:hypothetical protein [Lactobacillus sp.]